jgi:hypothetical protein
MPPGPARYDAMKRAGLLRCLAALVQEIKKREKPVRGKQPSGLRAVIFTAQHLVRKTRHDLFARRSDLLWTSLGVGSTKVILASNWRCCRVARLAQFFRFCEVTVFA